MDTSNIIELVILIDRSLSIRGHEINIYALYQKIIDRFQYIDRKCFITLGMFSDDVEFYCSHSDISHTKIVPFREFYPDGSTGLYDAVTKALTVADENIEYLQEIAEPQKILYVITDGIDNGSIYCEEITFTEELESRKNSGWTISFIDPSDQIILKSDT